MAADSAAAAAFDTLSRGVQMMCRNYMFANAVLLSEQLLAIEVNPCSVYLLANAFFLSGETERASSALQHHQAVFARFHSTSDANRANFTALSRDKSCIYALRCKNLHATCAFKLGKLAVAERILAHVAERYPDTPTSVRIEAAATPRPAVAAASAHTIGLFAVQSLRGPIDSHAFCDLAATGADLSESGEIDAAALHLLGCISRQTARESRAQNYFRFALLCNPMQFASYIQLCEMDMAPPAADLFGSYALPSLADAGLGKAAAHSHAASGSETNVSESGDVATPLASAAVPPGARRALAQQGWAGGVSGAPAIPPPGCETPSAPSTSALPPPPRKRSASTRAVQQQTNASPVVAATPQNTGIPPPIPAPVFVTPSPMAARQDGGATPQGSILGRRHARSIMPEWIRRDLQPLRKEPPLPPVGSLVSGPPWRVCEGTPREIGASYVYALLRILGTAAAHRSRYECSSAVATLLDLPPQHQATGWVLAVAGVCHYERTRLVDALDVFRRLRSIAPYHLEGLEYFSSVLWTVNHQDELGQLAHELSETFRDAPETWCVLGNCFSLHKEHREAVRYFQHAVELQPNMAYASTLAGFELAALGEAEAALAAFRTALAADERHYRAWFGMASVHLKNSKLPTADLSLRRALRIAPYNSVLAWTLGMTLFRRNRVQEALRELDTAIALDDRNTVAIFDRARVRISLGERDEALADLERLRDHGPKYAGIYAKLGALYSSQGDIDKALVHLNTALDLDPKGAGAAEVRELLEQITSREGEPESPADAPMNHSE